MSQSNNFCVHSDQDIELYRRIVPSLQVTGSKDEMEEAWTYWKAQSRLSVAMLNDEINPEEFLDALYDVMGKKLDPYIEETTIGLALMMGYV